jgi:hypothetical protein
MLFLSAISASTLVTFLFSEPYSQGLHISMPCAFSLVASGNGVMTKRMMVPRRNREPPMGAHMVELLGTR